MITALSAVKKDNSTAATDVFELFIKIVSPQNVFQRFGRVSTVILQNNASAARYRWVSSLKYLLMK